MATDLGKAGPKTRALLIKWNRLHLARTVLGALAAVSFLFAHSANCSWPRLDGPRPGGALMALVVIWPAGLQPR